jgi:hypothetical protein
MGRIIRQEMNIYRNTVAANIVDLLQEETSFECCWKNDQFDATGRSGQFPLLASCAATIANRVVGPGIIESFKALLFKIFYSNLPCVVLLTHL